VNLSKTGSRLSLAAKFNILTISLILITSAGITLFIIHEEVKIAYREMLNHGRTIVDMVSKNSEYGIYTENQETLLPIIEGLTKDPDIAYLSILNQKGAALAQKMMRPATRSPFPRPGGKPTVTNPFIHEEFIYKGDGKPYINMMVPVISSATDDSMGLFFDKERGGNQKIIGYVQIVFTQEGFRDRISSFLLSTLFFTTLLVAIGVAITLLVTRKIILPLQKLKVATQEISDGKFDHQIQIDSNDEISDLTQSFKHMLEHLKSYQSQVEEHSARLMAANQQMQQEISERKEAEAKLLKSETASKQLAQENAIIAEIGRIISSTLKIEEVYERFTEEVRKLVPFERIVINLMDHKTNTLTNTYVRGMDVRNRVTGNTVPLAGTPTEEVIRTGRSLLIRVKNKDEVMGRFPALSFALQAGVQSMILVPLVSKDQTIGTLFLQSTEPNAYGERELKLAEGVGTQIAGAIANAQLFMEREEAKKENMALEEQLRQSQKMEAVGQLAGGVAHDFNNLLTVINGNCEFSLLELKEEDPLKETLDEIKRAGERAAALTRQLLAFSRRQILEMKVVDLNSLIQDLQKMLRRVIGEDVDLKTSLSGNLGRVKADPGQIEQVIMNLAVNARDAMRSGGNLIIETANVTLDGSYARIHVGAEPGHYVMLSVSDTGMGMPPEVKERVFEPFFTTKEKGKGTGLGLSTVYGIVKQSGGNIWVYSEVGHGTTFKIYLPRVDGHPMESAEKVDRKEVACRGETILVVEDEEPVRRLLGRILQKRGYNVLLALNGDDAVSICQKQNGPIHLMVTDVVMPGMNGGELAKLVVPIRQEMKVLFMSGYTDDAIVHLGVLEPGINFIQKPFSPNALSQKIREVLAQ